MVYSIHESINALYGYITVNGNLRKSEGDILGFESLPVGTKEITYLGKKLQEITSKFIESLKKYSLNVEIKESNFSDAKIVLRKQVPFTRDAAKFTDGKWITGKIGIHVTGPHFDGTFTPLIDVQLEGTEECEEKLFGCYTGLPHYRDVRDILKQLHEKS